MSARINSSVVQRCACANIRRTDRIVTQFYDETLKSCGLNSTQFFLLVTLAEIAPITINVLAKTMTLDRTTVTRNLNVLIKQHLIQCQEGEDRRMRLVFLTQEGEQTLEHAWPLWQEAQSRIEHVFGDARLEALLTELSAVREAVS